METFMQFLEAMAVFAVIGTVIAAYYLWKDSHKQMAQG